MMEEQPFGLPQFKNNSLLNFLNGYVESRFPHIAISNAHVESKFPRIGECEGASLALCWHLSEKNCLVASQKDSHSIVLYDQKVWIDITCGIVINKDFSKFQKLIRFNDYLFNCYWGPEGLVTNSDFVFTLIKVSFYKNVKFK